MRSNSYCSAMNNFDVPYRFQRTNSNVNWNEISPPINQQNNNENLKPIKENSLIVFPALSYVSQLKIPSKRKVVNKTIERSKTTMYNDLINSIDSSYPEYFLINKSYLPENEKLKNNFTKVENMLDKYNNHTGGITTNSIKQSTSTQRNRSSRLSLTLPLKMERITKSSMKPQQKPPLSPFIFRSNNHNIDPTVSVSQETQNELGGIMNSKIWRCSYNNVSNSNNNNAGGLNGPVKGTLVSLERGENLLLKTKSNIDTRDYEDDENDDYDDDEEEEYDDETGDKWTDDGCATGNDDGDDDLGLEDCGEYVDGENLDSDAVDVRSDTESPTQEMLEQVRLKLNAESADALTPKCPFIYSLFPNIPPVIRFVREGESIMQLPWIYRKQMKWRNGSITPNVVKRAVKRSGFRLKDKAGPGWLGFFGKSLKASSFKTILEHQKINHLPGSFQLGRKDRLWRNVSLLAAKNSRTSNSDFKFLPKTFCLPSDLKLLERAWDEDENGSTGATKKRPRWIVKPPAAARGIGVRLVSRWNQIPKRSPIIVQSYLYKPFLINDSKFDLRVYVAVTSMDPLRCYVYNDGLVRFASHKYSKSSKNISNKFVHLTNYSINKKNQNYTSNEDHSKCQGHKWTLQSLWKHMEQELHIDWRPIWTRIKDYVLKTIICAESHINSNIKMYCAHKGCVFELFGFDVILDSKLRPWILEVNISPSLHSNSPLDIEVKSGLISDLFNLVGFKLYPPLQNSSNSVGPDKDTTFGALPTNFRRPSLSAPQHRSRSASINSSSSNSHNNNNISVNKKKQPSAAPKKITSSQKKLRKNSSSKSLQSTKSSTDPITQRKIKEASLDDACSDSSSILPATVTGKENEYPLRTTDLVYQERSYHYRTITNSEKQKHKYYIRKGYYDDPDIACTILNQLTIDDTRILIESIDEFNRAGKFELVHPVFDKAPVYSDNAQSQKTPNNQYLSYIASNSGCIYYNTLLREFIKKHSIPNPDNPCIPKFTESSIKLLQKHAQQIHQTNDESNQWKPPTRFGSNQSTARVRPSVGVNQFY